MSPRRRRAVATGIVLATVVLLRWVLPDAAPRREWSLLVMLCLGYGHQLGALVGGLRRGAGRNAIRTFAVVGSCFVGLLVLLPPVLLAALMTAIALWHVFENERAMARVPAQSDSSRLPGLSRAGAAWPPVILALVATIALFVAPARITRVAIHMGLPPAFAVWTWEDGIALLLLHHVVSWGLFATRGGSRRRVVLVHALPLAAVSLVGIASPAALVWLASPLPYLLTSVGHALHTAIERGVARG